MAGTRGTRQQNSVLEGEREKEKKQGKESAKKERGTSTLLRCLLRSFLHVEYMKQRTVWSVGRSLGFPTRVARPRVVWQGFWPENGHGGVCRVDGSFASIELGMCGVSCKWLKFRVCVCVCVCVWVCVEQNVFVCLRPVEVWLRVARLCLVYLMSLFSLLL